MGNEPELHVIRLPDLMGDERRAERERQRAEARRLHHEHLVAHLAESHISSTDYSETATTILDILFTDDCHCSCHPRLPQSDFHDYGFGCSCQQTAEERREAMSEWMAEMDAFWDSSEGRQVTAARKAEEDELAAWLADQPDVVVTSHGGMAPEQWRGSVEGRRFYFRERHDFWRIELDLRPSGRFYRAWTGGDLDDDANFELRETEEGDVIAEGVTGVPGYGHTPVERARFIIGTIRSHLRRDRCEVHSAERADLEFLFGRALEWCPACGLQLGSG